MVLNCIGFFFNSTLNRQDRHRAGRETGQRSEVTGPRTCYSTMTVTDTGVAPTPLKPHPGAMSPAQQRHSKLFQHPRQNMCGVYCTGCWMNDRRGGHSLTFYSMDSLHPSCFCSSNDMSYCGWRTHSPHIGCSSICNTGSLGTTILAPSLIWYLGLVPQSITHL